ncbi:DoxX family protein [Bradyrhizobium macuxiense]|uniref:DoxX family protein n=1 Tax=Bradyrhizobium macuxiense TaxID=1755647 RepID=UPI0011BF606C|nr:DoxX family protein [Bradyrhizobium macuxiense]
MSSSLSALSRPRWKTIAAWSLKIVFALAFLGAGLFKLSGAAPVVVEFDQIGLGQWFRYFTAACEVVGAVLLLLPATTGFGAFLLACVSVGAFVVQLLVLHGDVVHTIIFVVAMVGLAWANRAQIAGRLIGERR